MFSRFRVENVGRAVQGMKKMKSHDGRNLSKGIQSCLKIIYNRSQVLVPRKTHLLASTGRTEFTPGVGLNASGEVAYGGGAAPYAFVVHEVPAAHAPPTQAYYLSAAVNDTRGTCVSILRRQMKVRDTSS